MTTTDQLVTAAQAAKTTLTTAQATTAIARTAWYAATALCGMERANSLRRAGSTPPPPITIVPSPMPDFPTLAVNYTNAIVAENVARAAYNTAKAALNTALTNT